jgi:hypothetical protein
MYFWNHIRKCEHFETEILFSHGETKFCRFFACSTVTFSSSNEKNVGHPGFLLKSLINLFSIVLHGM